MNKYIESFQNFFGPLSTAQRTMFVGLVVVILGFVALLFYWAQQPDYTLLFGSLQPESAQEITQQLDSNGEEYKLEDGGRSIYVPGERVNELRVQLAPLGLSNPEVKGYELFDSNSLGMTDFMQQVNKKRALEGELARSINGLKQVESSRIHLVLPERSPFQETTVEASASCIISLKPGQRLDKEQIVGITSLIAGSVEGLDAANVTILDQAGNRLTDSIEANSDFASGTLQMQMRKKTESYLTERGQTMLDRVLGQGNSILRVSVERNFDKLTRESNKIDPDSRTIISEQRSSNKDNDEQRQPVETDEFTPADQRGETVVVSTSDNETESRTRNYEVNKTHEVFEKTQGEIKHLTASVLLNYKQTVQQNENGEEVVVNKPHSSEEVQQLKEVVRLALGIREERGDELSINQIEFYKPVNVEQAGYFSQPMSWNNILRWVLILLTFAAIVFLIRSIKNGLENSSTQAVLGLPNADVNSIPLGDNENEMLNAMDDEEKEKTTDRELTGNNQPKQLEPRKQIYDMDEITDFVELKPLEAAQVMRAMMTTEED